MPHTHINPIQKDNDIKKLFDLILTNYKTFIFSVLFFLCLAFFHNRFSLPVYEVSSSILIKEETTRPQGGSMNDFLNSNLLGTNQKFQNEIWVLKSSPVIMQTIKNLDLTVNYYYKSGLQYQDAYEGNPYKVLILQNHIQPLNVRFRITIQDNVSFQITAMSKSVSFVDFNNNKTVYQKKNWTFDQTGKFGALIENEDLAFIVQLDTNKQVEFYNESSYSFIFSNLVSLTNMYKRSLELNVIDKEATIIEIVCHSTSIKKGEDFVNELMNVYSEQNLTRKNHIAENTIDYIEKQLSEISDSLSQTEDNLQIFRSSNQLLNITEQASGISMQFMNLQNQLAELVTRKRYYDYVSDYLSKNDDFSKMTIPASMGIQDPLLNDLMSELISAQAQRSNLIENQQERNPLVQKLNIQIENIRKTITDNIDAVNKSTEISIDEMNKRIRKVESQISQLPKTQRQLGGIERKYRLNDAIYNYLLEKRAEAKITQASNLPDNIILEPATMVGAGPVSPKKRMNYLVALVLGMVIPIGLYTLRSILNNKIESQENLQNLTNAPVLGKILHNHWKSNNVVFGFPKSSIAESYRALRTNLEFCFRGTTKKVILVTSSIEGEGKSFNSLNIAMSYAQLDRKTLLIDFDLRKPSGYFNKEEAAVGLSSYLIDHAFLEDIILHSPHEKLDYIPSGPIPPNPTELLAMAKIKDLIANLKESYDCIVLDTTPLAQVSDAYLLMDFAEVKIVVARYNYTHKKIFSMIMKDLEQKEISNVYIMLNDNKDSNGQYGYGYGYNQKRSWFSKLMKKNGHLNLA